MPDEQPFTSRSIDPICADVVAKAEMARAGSPLTTATDLGLPRGPVWPVWVAPLVGWRLLPRAQGRFRVLDRRRSYCPRGTYRPGLCTCFRTLCPSCRSYSSHRSVACRGPVRDHRPGNNARLTRRPHQAPRGRRQYGRRLSGSAPLGPITHTLSSLLIKREYCCGPGGATARGRIYANCQR
jgi:hypothetical protein